MKKIVLLFLITVSFIFAKEDYSEMSTQELIAIMGYVKKENKSSFTKELNSRIPTMSGQEKEQFEKNKEKLNNEN